MKSTVKAKVERAVRDLWNIDPPPFKVDKPKDEKLGDLAVNVAFLLAKELRKNPQEIAQSIADRLSEDGTFSGVEAVRGFLNFRFSREFLLGEFSRLLDAGEDFFREDLGRGEKVQIEFVSANPTGPLHLGHGRGAVVGDTLARLLEFFGYNVVREYYVNDAGRQVYLLGVSILYRYLESFHKEDLRPDIKETFEREGYRGDYVREIALMVREAVGDALTRDESPESLKDRLLNHGFPFPLNYTESFREGSQVDLLARFGMDFLMAEIRKDLEDLGVRFDVWFSERSLQEEGEVRKVLKELEDKGFAYRKEGALWVRTSEFGDDKDRVAVRSDGTYTYFASDIAYHLNKFGRGFRKVINLWGADHFGYVARIRAVLKMLGVPEDWLEIYMVQTVRLFRGGKEVRMSKRAGEFVTLRELMEEVGPDPIRFVFLTKRSDTPLDFDLDLVKEKSSENPVFYVQYAHARISGVFREFRERFREDPENMDLKGYLDRLVEEQEMKLIKKTLLLKDELVEITLAREPHVITYLLLDLASTFHNYYNHYRVIGSPEEIMLGRVALLRGVRTALRVGLKLIGVSAPEKM
jgi:arginyl-tRNA synthetase